MTATTRPGRLVLVGSVVVDLTLQVPRLPDRGGDVIAGGMVVAAGGGRFVLEAARAAGLPAVYLGRHGAGPLGEAVRAALGAAGVELALHPDTEGDTGPCIVLVEPDGERTMITSNGVEAELPADALAPFPVRSDDAVYVSGYDLAYPVSGPAIVSWLGTLPAQPLVIIDPGPLVAELPREVITEALARADVLTLNAREADLLAGTAEPGAAYAALAPRLPPGAVVVLRDGPRGATALTAGAEPVHVALEPVAAPDTTGAGDTHTGALVAALGRGADWRTALTSAAEDVADLLRVR